MRRGSPLTPLGEPLPLPEGMEVVNVAVINVAVINVDKAVDLLPELGVAWLALMALAAGWTAYESIRRDPMPTLRPLRELLDEQLAELDAAMARGDRVARGRVQRELAALARTWTAVLAGHRPDPRGHCGYCRSGWGRRRRWPCAAWRAAAEALRLLRPP